MKKMLIFEPCAEACISGTYQIQCSRLLYQDNLRRRPLPFFDVQPDMTCKRGSYCSEVRPHTTAFGVPFIRCLASKVERKPNKKPQHGYDDRMNRDSENVSQNPR